VKRAHTTTDTEETNPVTLKPTTDKPNREYEVPSRRFTVREMPSEERPSDRLLTAGGEALSDAELVSILLKTGRAGVSSIELARELLEEVGGIHNLVGARDHELHRPGIGSAKAATLLASVELACRLSRETFEEHRPVLSRPAAVARYLHLRYRRNGQEILGAMYLDCRQRPIHSEVIYQGTLDRCAAEPRAILRTAILKNAKGFILFHTHPTGDPSPSAQDLTFTEALREAGTAVGVELHDHLILGAAGRWVSLRERGDW